MFRKIASCVFYVLAAPFLIFAVWAFSNSAEIISEAIETGQITLFGNLYDIAGFYMANTGAYFAYAFMLIGAGLLLGTKEGKTHYSTTYSTTGKNASNNSENDAELDEWFDSHDNKEDEK